MTKITHPVMRFAVPIMPMMSLIHNDPDTVKKLDEIINMMCKDYQDRIMGSVATICQIVGIEFNSMPLEEVEMNLKHLGAQVTAENLRTNGCENFAESYKINPETGERELNG